MIGFNRLGQLGRLGNQMFQYAALRGIAARHGRDICIPPSLFRDPWTDHQLFYSFELGHLRRIGLLAAPEFGERMFAYDAELVERCPDHVTLAGYFQTERYFAHLADEIRADFTFRSAVRAAGDRFLATTPPAKIALHVRRTDYLTDAAAHPPCSLDYYAAALARLDAAMPVVVFSDDVDWCAAQTLFASPRFVLARGMTNDVDMYVMSKCDHFIIANSSFSWWGAWLSVAAGKRVIAPARWFGEGYTAAHDTRDLVPRAWEIV